MRDNRSQNDTRRKSLEVPVRAVTGMPVPVSDKSVTGEEKAAAVIVVMIAVVIPVPVTRIIPVTVIVPIIRTTVVQGKHVPLAGVITGAIVAPVIVSKFAAMVVPAPMIAPAIAVMIVPAIVPMPTVIPAIVAAAGIIPPAVVPNMLLAGSPEPGLLEATAPGRESRTGA